MEGEQLPGPTVDGDGGGGGCPFGATCLAVFISFSSSLLLFFLKKNL